MGVNPQTPGILRILDKGMGQTKGIYKEKPRIMPELYN